MFAVVLVLGILLILFFLFVAYMSSKTWHWFHVIVLTGLFGVSIWFMFNAVQVGKTHVTWKQQYFRLKDELARLEKDGRELEFGPVDMAIPPEPGDGSGQPPPVSTLLAALERVTYDRGRAWRNCKFVRGDLNTNLYELQTPIPDGAASNGIAVDDLLYAFAESGKYPGTDIPIEQEFLGEFRVTAVTNNTVTLSLTMPPNVFPLTNLNVAANFGWALYALMPADGHIFFADSKPKGQYQTPIFGTMNQAKISALIPANQDNPFQAPPQSPFPVDYDSTRAAVVQELVRDGDVWRNEDGHAVENHWVRVRFTKDWTEDVDSGEGTNSRPYFNLEGQAHVPTLKRGEPVKFVNNDFGIFPIDYYESTLRDKNVCVPAGDIYVRRLNDFNFAFHEIYSETLNLRHLSQVEQGHINAVKRMQARTENQLRIRNTEKMKLTADKTKFDAEQKAAEDYAAQLNQQWANLQEELKTLYTSNLALEQQLNKINAKLTEEINQRTNAAVEAPGS